MSTANPKRSTSLRLDKELYSYIELPAKKENRSVNNFIETLLAKATSFYGPNEQTKRDFEETRKEKPFMKRNKNTQEAFGNLLK